MIRAPSFACVLDAQKRYSHRHPEEIRQSEGAATVEKLSILSMYAPVALQAIYSGAGSTQLMLHFKVDGEPVAPLPLCFTATPYPK